MINPWEPCDSISTSEKVKNISVYRAQIVACASRYIGFHLITTQTQRTTVNTCATCPWGGRGLFHRLQTLEQTAQCGKLDLRH